MLPLALALLVQAAAPQAHPFEITSNKPFVQVKVGDSGPLWFILDTGNNNNSVISREAADRLKLASGEEERARIGAGSGASVGISEASEPAFIRALGETLTVARPTLFTMKHISGMEGRRVDGLLGRDFMSRHVLEIDYAKGTMTIHDPASYTPPAGAQIVPVSLETGWPVADATITPAGGKPIPCQLLIDTGMRGTVTLFRPFADQYGLHELPGNRRGLVFGMGAGGLTSGDVGRLDAMTIGPLSFTKPVASFATDTVGIFSIPSPQGIVGGEVLRRYRTTFDYPHGRMVMEPYKDAAAVPFDYDMSGVFLVTEAPDYVKIRVMAVNAKTPAEEAGLKPADEIVSIDGRATPKLTLDDARGLLRTPGVRRLEIRREGKVQQVKLTTRRMV